MKTEQSPTVHALLKVHVEGVAALETAAAHDPRLVYDGCAWTIGGIREYLRGGRGLVALNTAGTVVGFALFHLPLDSDEVRVAKLVAPTRLAHRALWAALIALGAQNGRTSLLLPLVLELA